MSLQELPPHLGSEATSDASRASLPAAAKLRVQAWKKRAEVLKSTAEPRWEQPRPGGTSVGMLEQILSSSRLFAPAAPREGSVVGGIPPGKPWVRGQPAGRALPAGDCAGLSPGKAKSQPFLARNCRGKGKAQQGWGCRRSSAASELLLGVMGCRTVPERMRNQLSVLSRGGNPQGEETEGDSLGSAASS